MAEIIKRKKQMSVSPLKSSQPIGASLTFLGINQAMPLMHGSQGCTAFAKVFFVRHFRESIPLQTTVMDQGSTVLVADESILEALDTICKKNSPAMIVLCTTGLSETQGADIRIPRASPGTCRHGGDRGAHAGFHRLHGVRLCGCRARDDRAAGAGRPRGGIGAR